MRNLTVVGCAGGVVALIVACAGGGGGSGGGSTGAIGAWLDRFAPAYCTWLTGCGSDDGATCPGEVSGEVALYRGCPAAESFYTQNRIALDACLDGKPACGGDDAVVFCPALAGLDAIERQCKEGTSSGGTGTSSGGTSGGATSGGGLAGCGSAPANAYRCADDDDTIEVCKNGAWQRATECSCAVKVGDPRKPPYAATCKSIIGTADAVECSYAGIHCLQCLPGTDCKTSCTKCATENSSSCCP